jgi:hypothetical protein
MRPRGWRLVNFALKASVMPSFMESCRLAVETGAAMSAPPLTDLAVHDEAICAFAAYG